MKEISRGYYGGGDGKAINRHSVREYQDESGKLYLLDRCTDIEGRPFVLWSEYKRPGPGLYVIPKEVKVEGLESAKSWKQAEKILFNHVSHIKR